MASEQRIEKTIVDWLVAQGCASLKIGQNGYPDRLFITPRGEYFWVEVKTPKGRLSNAQKIRIDSLKKRNCRAITVTSLIEVKEFWNSELIRELP